jgi:hypothetical protein
VVDVDALVSRLTAERKKKTSDEEIQKIVQELKRLEKPVPTRPPQIQAERCSELSRPRKRVQPEISVVAREAARWGGLGCGRSGFVSKKFVDDRKFKFENISDQPLTHHLKPRSITQQAEIFRRLSVPRILSKPYSRTQIEPPVSGPQPTARSSSYGCYNPRALLARPVDPDQQRASVERLSSGLNPFMRARLAELRAQTQLLFPSPAPATPPLLSSQPSLPVVVPAAPTETEEIQRVVEEVLWMGVSGSRIYEELDEWLATTAGILLDEEFRVQSHEESGVTAKESSVARLGRKSGQFFGSLKMTTEKKTRERLKVLRDAMLMKIAQLERRSRAMEILSSAMVVDEEDEERTKEKRRRRKISFWEI